MWQSLQPNLLFGTDSLRLRSSLTLCTVLTYNSPRVFRFSVGLVKFLPTKIARHSSTLGALIVDYECYIVEEVEEIWCCKYAG